MIAAILNALRRLFFTPAQRYRIRSNGTPDAVLDHGATIIPGRVIDPSGALSK